MTHRTASCIPAHRPRRASTLRGFSVIELMVAMAIGLMLLGGLITLFANSSRAGNEAEKSIRQLENGRFALELMNEDITLAGYYAELVMTDAVYQTPDACATANTTALGWKNPSTIPLEPLKVPVAVTGLGTTQAALLTCLSNLRSATPALVVHHLDTERKTPGSATNGTWHVQTSRCAGDPVSTRFILSDKASDFTLRGLNCTGTNEVQRYLTRVYYLASCNECGIDTVPTLKRADLVGSAMVVTPLAEGIEDMAFEYGFDTNADGNPDIWRTGLSGTALAADNDWANVVGVRTFLLSRTTEASPGYKDEKTYEMVMAGTRGPFNDAFKRRVYSITSRLNNVAGPRELP